MKMIITPEEVIASLFGTSTTLRAEDVAQHTILAAQQRYLRPALGAQFYDSLVAEEPDDDLVAFAEGYLKLPLALYVVSVLLPTIASQVGATGVVRLKGESFESVDERTLCRLRRRLRSDADALLDGALEYLAVNPELYPSYDPQESVRNRVHFAGGVLL